MSDNGTNGAHGGAPTSLVLIDSNRLLREGITTLIAKEPDMKLLAATADVHEGMKLVLTHHPDVLLLYIGVTDADALELTARVRREAPKVRVILTGFRPNQDDIVACLKSGASGFTMRDASLEEYFAALRAVAAGEEILPLPVLRALVMETSVRTASDRKAARETSLTLTTREYEIAVHLADGLTNKEIAEILHIAVQTVKSHVHHILEKLKLRSRFEILGSKDYPSGTKNSGGS